MTTNQPRSVGRRFWWIIRTTLLIFIFVALVAAVLAGLGYAGFLGVQEIQRSNSSLAMRIDANEQNLNSLRDLVNSEFAEGDPQQQMEINQLESELATLKTQLEALQAAQTEHTAVQAEQLGTVEADLAAALAQNENLVGELDAVQAALVALQSDLNSSGVRLNELSSDVDGLRLQLAALDEVVTEFTDETAVARSGDSADFQQSLTLLQLWGVLTNARLALADGDETGAETAVAQAITLANNLLVQPDSATAAALARLQTRLSLAAAGFATNLPMVAQDLSAASQELTVLLSGSNPEPAEEAIDTTLDDEADEITPTPIPSATPIPTSTPTP